jgi:hypothetical protein
MPVLQGVTAAGEEVVDALLLAAAFDLLVGAKLTFLKALKNFPLLLRLSEGSDLLLKLQLQGLEHGCQFLAASCRGLESAFLESEFSARDSHAEAAVQAFKLQQRLAAHFFTLVLYTASRGIEQRQAEALTALFKVTEPQKSAKRELEGHGAKSRS